MNCSDRFLASKAWSLSVGGISCTTKIVGDPRFVRIWVQPSQDGFWFKVRLRLDPRSGGPIGYALLGFHEREAEISDIKIYPRWRGRGVGTAFLDFLLIELRRAGFERVQGKMSGDLARLARWYSRAGFMVGGDVIQMRL